MKEVVFLNSLTGENAFIRSPGVKFFVYFRKVLDQHTQLNKMSTEWKMVPTDRVEQFFEGKTVLITGVTGFLGKVLLEKLLRACPKVEQVVAIVRAKKNKFAEERIQSMLDGPLFDKLRKERPEQLEKIVTIRGDMTKIGLDLTKEDLEWLCEEVQVVFHCAATIRFDEPLKRAVILNVRGTREMLELAKKMRNLQVFQHVSTAYCHLEEKELLEKPYDPPANPHHIIKICEWLKEEDVELLSPRLLAKSPNTYAYTKALGEALVVEEMNNIPALIFRPSVVIPIWKEPLPGWTDNFNGVAGILIGAGKGVIRTMHVEPDASADYIPVDVVANALLVFTFLSSFKPEKRIYHLTTDKLLQRSYRENLELGEKLMNKIPLPGAVWYPGGSMKKSKLYNNICIFLFHTIPAILVDTLLYILGFEPVLMKVQRRINKGFEVFEYYANNQWRFNNEETLKQRDMMNPTERKKYKMDNEGIDHEEYMTNAILFVRRHMLNEPDDTIPASRRKMTILWLVDRACKILFVSLFLYMLYQYCFSRFFS